MKSFITTSERPLPGWVTFGECVHPHSTKSPSLVITVYDNQTRSLLQTDNPYPGVTSIDKATVQHADGSFDVYIGPKKPDGKVNWIQTDPSKGWNMLWRIYGPTQVWYD